MSEAIPKERELPAEMDGVRTLDTPALVSPDSTAPLRVFVPQKAARSVSPGASHRGHRQWAGVGVLATREARECGYRVRKIRNTTYDHDDSAYIVTLEVDGDV